ncbi:hypothetical protein BJ508DRAFT_418334 [Ascobolus immersus RN42]|uniref:Uncharacterized protein n=1 Tax=Ascobolus immersus RN42 TaxID=1160509 RepID=A0A3N4HMK0_ASCIM|nr:hypothetical protein BJ508DRAFT_418334 [Ascobolus immersus RN42]
MPRHDLLEEQLPDQILAPSGTFTSATTNICDTMFADRLSGSFKASQIYHAMYFFLGSTDQEAYKSYLVNTGTNIAMEDTLRALDGVDPCALPLAPIVQEAITFFAQSFGPHCWNLLSVEDRRILEDGRGMRTPAEMYLWLVLSQLVAMPGKRSASTCERYHKGLLRTSMVRLLEAALGSFLDELRMLMKHGAPYESLSNACGDWNTAFDTFFTDERFRSERIELLILKYLDEDGIDMELVGGIRLQTEKFRLEYNALMASELSDEEKDCIRDSVFQRTP